MSLESREVTNNINNKKQLKKTNKTAGLDGLEPKFSNIEMS